MKTRIEGRCIWLREAIAPDEEDCPALQGNQTADVCIVGGGFAGMWTAIELKRRQPSLDVAIVEADICGGGRQRPQLRHGPLPMGQVPRPGGVLRNGWRNCAGQVVRPVGRRDRGLLSDARHRRRVPPRRLDLGRHLRAPGGVLERHHGGAGSARGQSVPLSRAARRSPHSPAVALSSPGSSIPRRQRCIPASWCAVSAASC